MLISSLGNEVYRFTTLRSGRLGAQIFNNQKYLKIVKTLKLSPELPLRKMAVIGSASANFKIMWSLKLTNKKPIEVKKIVFDNVAGIFDYPKNIRIPNVGEYVWFSIWKQGTVISVENKFEDGFFCNNNSCW